MQTNAKRITLTYGETDNREALICVAHQQRNNDGTDPTRGADNRQVFDSPRRITEPRNIPYIDGFGILKLLEDPGILRNSSELFENSGNSRNFTRFLF